MYARSIRVMHMIVPWYPWLPHSLTTYSLIVNRVISLYTHTWLVLTFVVMSRWTTLDLHRLMWNHGLSWTTLRRVDFLHFCGTPWRTLGTPLTQSTLHVRSWPQANSFVVKWRWRFQCAWPILLGKNGSVWHTEETCPTRCRRLLSRHSQLSCGKHPAEIVNSVAKVIPVPERHIAPGGEWETILPAQSNSHYSPDLVSSVRFSEAMYDAYRRMVGESVFYRHQVHRYKVKKWSVQLKHWRKPEQW
jgi:hypothetical protein